MGNSSIIARRISDKYVQYGFSGNGGYFRNVGLRLLIWYNERKSDEYPEYDDLIEYLFSLGETSLIGSLITFVILNFIWEEVSKKSSAK